MILNDLLDKDSDDVPHDVNLWRTKISSISLASNVDGFVDISENLITSLEGSPITVGDFFDCRHNLLTSLKGAPQKISGAFSCGENKLTTLEYGPAEVYGSYSCDNNKLTSLKGVCSRIYLNFDCSKNNLSTLDYIPSKIGAAVSIRYNKLTSLIGIDDKLTHIGTSLSLGGNPITEGGLGLLLIDHLQNINSAYDVKDMHTTTVQIADKVSAVCAILSEYLKRPDAIYDCQQELIKEGYEEFAQI